MSSVDSARTARRRAAIMAAVALYLQETSEEGSVTEPPLPALGVREVAPAVASTGSRSLSLSTWKTATWSPMRSEMVKSGPAASSRQKRSAWRAQ